MLAECQEDISEERPAEKRGESQKEYFLFTFLTIHVILELIYSAADRRESVI